MSGYARCLCLQRFQGYHIIRLWLIGVPHLTVNKRHVRCSGSGVCSDLVRALMSAEMKNYIRRHKDKYRDFIAMLYVACSRISDILLVIIYQPDPGNPGTCFLWFRYKSEYGIHPYLVALNIGEHIGSFYYSVLSSFCFYQSIPTSPYFYFTVTIMVATMYSLHICILVLILDPLCVVQMKPHT